MNEERTGRRGFYIIAACAFALGALLRLDHLPSQILLDDEWHGLNQVVGSSFGEALESFDAKDNTSLPLNLYHWLLLHTAGWSELTIRLPVIAAGLLGLLLMPLAARKIAGDRAALFFAFLLAIAPFAIFYSRFSRAYIIIMLLGFIALAAARRWLATGERRAGAAFLTAGTIAVWTHPMAIVVVVVPFVLYYWTAHRRHIRNTGDRGDDPGEGRGDPGKRAGEAAAGASMPPAGTGASPSGITVPPAEVMKFGLMQLLLILPVGWMMLTAGRNLPWGEGSWSASGLADAATLLSGTMSVPLNILFYLFFVAGTAVMFRKDPLFARMITATALIYALVLLVSRPLGLETGVVVLRYMIVLVPLSLLAVAVGMDSLAAKFVPRIAGSAAAGVALRALPVVLFGLFLFFLHAAGPIPGVYNQPNDFTNHSAYQGRYDSPDTAVSDSRHVYPGPRIPREDVPQFYRDLRVVADVGSVVEYPMDITNYNNLLYFYQMIHGKRVIAGYCPDRALLGHSAELPPGEEGVPLRLGMLSADQILSRVSDREMLKFRNMVDVTDPAALAETGAGVLILHKYVEALRFLPGRTATARVWYRSVPHLANRYRGLYGPPIYEDGSIICFQIGNT